jgi:hypothetical protein
MLAKIGKYDGVEYFCKGVGVKPRIWPYFRLIQAAEGLGVIGRVDATERLADNMSLSFRLFFKIIGPSIVVFGWLEEVERCDIRDVSGRRKNCRQST